MTDKKKLPFLKFVQTYFGDKLKLPKAINPPQPTVTSIEFVNLQQFTKSVEVSNTDLFPDDTTELSSNPALQTIMAKHVAKMNDTAWKKIVQAHITGTFPSKKKQGIFPPTGWYLQHYSFASCANNGNLIYDSAAVASTANFGFMNYASVNDSIPETAHEAAARVRADLAKHDGKRSPFDVFCTGEHLLTLVALKFNGDEIRLRGEQLHATLIMAGHRHFPKLMEKRRRQQNGIK